MKHDPGIILRADAEMILKTGIKSEFAYKRAKAVFKVMFLDTAGQYAHEMTELGVLMDYYESEDSVEPMTHTDLGDWTGDDDHDD